MFAKWPDRDIPTGVANEMFKVYVRIRTSLYEDVKDNVEDAWRADGGV
jgi:hypothetical protein